LKKHEEKVVIATTAALTAITSTSIAIKTYFCYTQALRQYKILKAFKEDPEYDYEKLTNDVCDLYYEQWFPSRRSLNTDYPAVWLEESATFNQKLFSWMFFSKACRNISKKLNRALQHLRKIKQFKDEKKECNDKYRKQIKKVYVTRF